MTFFLLLGLAGWAGGGGEAEEEGTVMAAAGEYKESPMLAELVAKGELPPVDERLPVDPPVVEVESIGEYGGILQRFVTNVGGLPHSFMINPRFLRKKVDGTRVLELMSDIQMNDEFTVATLTLREGVRWSDGELLKVEDLLFAFNDLQLHPDVKTWQGFQHDGATKIDDLTLRFDLLRPYPKSMSKFASLNGSSEAVQPKHYLQKWHIDYNDKANELAKDEGFDFWYEALRSHFWWSPHTDADTPTLRPWMFTTLSPSFGSWERNPYYIRVDPAGNQLPYLDGITEQQVDAELYNLKIITGETDLAFTATSFDNFSLYKENESAQNYTVHELVGPSHSETLLRFSLASIDPVKAQYYSQAKFRQAMSIAINREEINKVVFKGKGVPRQATIKPGVSYYNPEWAEAYAEYDPATANKWLDEVGLDKKDADGFRVGSDGKTMLTVVQYAAGRTKPAVITTLELIKEYWEAVGVKTLVKATDRALLQQLGYEGTDVGVAIGEGVVNFRMHKWANPWSRWNGASDQVRDGIKTLADFADGKLPGAEPEEWAKEYWTWQMGEVNLYEPDSRGYADVVTKMLDVQAEKLMQIGTVGMVPYLVIAKNYVHNLPTQFPTGTAWPGALAWFADRIYMTK
jgi:peptide/nickel transport system substrate-binding protein